MLDVIFDTDPGIDDAMALLFLARARRVRLLAITTVFGNATIGTATRNALVLADRFGLAVPVAEGAAGPLVGEADPPPTFVHGENGLGNIDITPSLRRVDPRPAHRLIIDLVRANPHQITLIAVGRMTNLALALRDAPEIAGLVKQVVIMGGAFGRNGHTGNVTPVAEANIWGDPVAADVVFGAAWPMTVAGLDVTQQTIMTEAFLADLAANGGEDGRFMRAISRFYQDFHRTSAGLEGFYVHDSSAVAAALRPDLFTGVTGAIRVVPNGIAIGQTILKPDGRTYPPGPWDNRPSHTVLTGVQSAEVIALYRDTLLGA
jgi:inosine-uridine nucleoside N-ribohydrolase